MTSEAFLRKYGERWYLRDFDFYIEKLSERIEREKDISSNFLRQLLSNDGSDKIFNSEKEAILACIKVRKVLGLKNSDSLKARAFDILNAQAENDIHTKAILFDKLFQNQ